MANPPGTYWPSLLRELDSTERAWNTRSIHYPRKDAVPFLPYPMPQFISLLTDAVMTAPVRMDGPGEFRRNRFLDVGAGVGTKMRLATAMFGLESHGIELVPEMAAEAQAHGLDMAVCDAFNYADYDLFDIVYLNRPSTQMDELEHLIMAGMKPRSVLMLVNAKNDPGKEGWTLVAQEYGEPVAGVWIKP